MSSRSVAQADGAAGPTGVLGIHIEGPFLNVERKGAHDPAKLRVLDTSAVGLLSSLSSGVTVATLAPEMTTPRIIQLREARVPDDGAARDAPARGRYPALDLYLTTNTSNVPATPQIDDVATGAIGGYTGIGPAGYEEYFVSHGVSSSNALDTSKESFSKNEHRTFVAFGDQGSFAVAEINENQNAPSSGHDGAAPGRDRSLPTPIPTRGCAR